MVLLFGMVIGQTREMQVSALSKKLILPAVNTSEFGDCKIIEASHALANLLSGLEVMATDFFEFFATLMFEIVFPEIETK